MKWIEDVRLRETVYFILFDTALFLFLFYLDREDGTGRAGGLLIAAFVSLFGMLLLFLWTNRQNVWLITGAILFYLFLGLYWI
ncbi:hypothetical protein A0126_17740 (plasmid) [Exiguobacterium sp. N4-1P]|uniref:hypothetical protein n=1 Tax=Exiguobacterium sp. N4-1P TaxID=2051906 RepID=UPI000B58B02E|nr:hypothetical protein [Exiguobacterium sp. N4-1P]ASI35401.1 hypothetical protein A0126_07460 [Exiguobacterium sp. N4-1P]ASI37414.1 hypothetical protein A0126_17740 [Exiguobacterium sp. N4-1P]